MIKPNSKSPLGLLFRSSSPFYTIGVVRLWNLSVFLQEFSIHLFGKQFEIDLTIANCKSGILLWKLSGSSRFCKCPMNQSSRNILITSNKRTSCFYIFLMQLSILIGYRKVRAEIFIIVLTIQFTTLQFKVDRELDNSNATANFPSKKDPWGSR